MDEKFKTQITQFFSLFFKFINLLKYHIWIFDDNNKKLNLSFLRKKKKKSRYYHHFYYLFGTNKFAFRAWLEHK